MLSERPIHPDTKDMLVANEPFSYAHLIKFERPNRLESNGVASTSWERYTYLSDASRDVMFDDGSTSLSGIPNGSQNYLANKVLNLSSVSEQVEAKASTYNIVLDGTAIGAFLKGSGSITKVNSEVFDLTIGGNLDPVRAGFREGDKVTLKLFGDFNIHSFRVGNVIRLTKIDYELSSSQEIPVLELSLSSEEIKSILLDKNGPNYASFINREVFIYRGYFQEGALVGEPILLFKGIISNVSFEDSDTDIRVTWGLTSHWGDFAQVKGRITSDEFHRALDQHGNPQPQSALKVSYAYDKGFSHSETSLNILATYIVQVEKQKIKTKSGVLGIGSKVKVKTYYEDEARTTQLDFQLQAKAIPVIYGVRNTEGMPVFADTLNSDNSTVYILYVLSEGEIGGIYDVYIDDKSLICNDKSDFDARSTQTADNTVELICRGRADRGDVLGGSTSVSTVTYENFYEGATGWDLRELYYNYILKRNSPAYVEPVTTTVSNLGKGVVDGESIKLTSPQEITLDVFSGKTGQIAAPQLVKIAKEGNFKIQNDYWKGSNTAEYWGPNHRLADTAYVLAKVIIAEGETSIPSLDFVVRGKTIDCYNYDRSYSHYNKVSGENADNFSLGDMVDLYNASGVKITSSPIQIIDKWTFSNADGTPNTRFRFDIDPPLVEVNGVPTVTRFSMRNASSQNWTMITHNFTELVGTVPSAVSTVITESGTSGSNSTIQYSANAAFISGGTQGNATPYYSVVNSDGSAIQNNRYFNTDSILLGTSSSTSSTLVLDMPSSSVASSLGSVVGKTLISRNTINLGASASSEQDFYKGSVITLTRYLSSADKELKLEADIIAYNGTYKIATIDTLWPEDFVPKAGDTFQIYPKYRDSRVSINPAIQLLDYTTSTTYGKGLDPHKDIDLPSWLNSARICDAQSNVTVCATSGAGGVVPGHKYQHTEAGKVIFQGTVVGSLDGYIEFTNIIGKFTNAWNSWKAYAVGELVYNGTRMYKVTVAGVKFTEPTHTSGITNGLEYLSTLSLSSINGGPTLVLDLSTGNPVKALKNGSAISGYSLYDCDEVNYWRLLGWDEHSQRYVTRHQTNLVIDTANSIFDNTNSFLEHFGGLLTYIQGKYYLAVEEAEGLIASDGSDIRNVTSDEIVGKIKLADEGIKKAYNSLTAAYSDPANNFEARNISFFNSEYLQIDRNVPKKGNISIPGITNYYNTRILTDKYLSKSRFGLTISMTLRPMGILLLPGQVIQLQYPRYGWVDKKFRITSLTHQTDTMVDVVAEEYDDSFYILSKISKQAGLGLAGNTNITPIASPTGLKATGLDAGDEEFSGVNLTWVNNPLANTKNVYTEVYSSYSSRLYLTINTINSNVLTSTVDHGLKVGELIYSQVTAGGLELGKSYFVLSTPTTTTFTLSETKGGTIKGFPNNTGLGAIMRTASLIATLPIPMNTYLDPLGGVESRVVKYYWVRHKILQGF